MHPEHPIQNVWGIFNTGWVLANFDVPKFRASFSMIGLAESCSTLLLSDKLLNGLEGRRYTIINVILRVFRMRIC